MIYFDLLINSPATFVLIILILALSLYVFYHEDLLEKVSLMPYDIIRYKEIYRIFSSGFIHANYQHLGLNLLVLLIFGTFLETKLDSGVFLLIFFLGLVVSNLATIIRYRWRSDFQSVGASGAISAIVLGAIVIDPTLQLELFFILPVPGWLFALSYILYSIYGANFSGGNVNHDAHLWGAISGIVTTFILFPQSLNLWNTFIMG